MKRAVQTILGLGLAVTVVACGDNRPDGADPNAAVGTTGAAAANVDGDFIEDQLEDGNREVVLGRLAAERATHPQVKEFGQMMATEHTAAGEELRQLAARANVRLEADTDGDDDLRDMNEKLGKLSCREFDLEYMAAMIDEHKEAIDDVEGKVEGAEHADVKQWAATVLPKLRAHLAQAERIHETLKQADSR